MTEIKKGDWVYKGPFHEKVFLCDRFDDNGNPYDCEGWGCSIVYCHRLTPLKPGEAKVGDRVAVLQSVYDKIEDGSIWRLKHRNILNGCIELSKEGLYFEFDELARLPDCAQDKPITVIPIEEDKLDSIPKAPTSKQIQMAIGLPMDTKCPHPEWEGVWVNELDLPIWVEWKSGHACPWKCYSRVDNTYDEGWSDNWKGPKAEGWTQLEPAPTASTAGPKLSRPQKHGGIKTPVDTW